LKKLQLYLKLLSALLLLFISCNKTPTAPADIQTTPYVWAISTPADQKIDDEKLAEGFSAAKELRYMKSLLVIRNGFLVKEEYFKNYTRYTTHICHSVSKSFLSAFTGIAIERGDIPGLDKKAFDYFSEYEFPTFDQRKKNITIKHLLTMKPGFSGDKDVYFQVATSNNWIKKTWQLPLIADPGTEFHYNTFATHLLSASLTEATGMPTLDYANNHFFPRLGITCDRWEKGPSGYYFGGNNMYFTTRDMAVLGLLYLNKGKLNGKQIVPAHWVKESLEFSTSTTTTWGAMTDVGYGYLWWLGKIKGEDVFMALGFAGQYIAVFPDLQLIIAVNSETTSNWKTADRQERGVLQIIADYLLPAVSIQ